MARKLTTNLFKIALLGGLALGVAGCESTRETFGLNKQAPDEFQVVSRAPLSLPPDFTLRVPEPGAARPQTGTTTEINLTDYFKANDMTYNPVVFEKLEEVNAAYDANRCDVYTTDSSALAAERSGFPDPDAHVILPEIISKEPLGPSVRSGDAQWFNIAKWTLFAMLNAEELGVTSENVDDMLGSENPSVRRLLGVEGDFGTPIGLSADWAYKIVKHVGNYGELYAQHVGPETPINIPRGVTSLWTDGGVMYAPPIR